MRGSNGASEPSRRVGRQARRSTSAERNRTLGLEQAGQRVGGGELRAVEQRQPFLRAERRAARARPRASASAAGMRAPSTNDLADADHRRGHMRRAARDRPRRRPSLAPARPASGRAPASPPAARASRGRTPEAPCARLASFSAIISRTIGDRRRLADAGGMRQHDVALQRVEIGRRDAHAGQLAEAGIDAIDRLALGDDARDRRGARRDRRPAGGIELGAGAAIDRAPIGERRRAGLQDDRRSLAPPDARHAAG